MRRKCRIWWPKHLGSSEPQTASSMFLFGWFVFSSSDSLDVVVAFASKHPSLSSSLQEVLSNTNRNLPTILQHKSAFSLLGQCATYISRNEKNLKAGIEESVGKSSSVSSVTKVLVGEHYGGRNCECHLVNGLVEQCWHKSKQCSHWIQLVYGCPASLGRNICWVPELHHLHWQGELISKCDVHVILYETPSYGTRHFSLNFGKSPDQVKVVNKPKWIDELRVGHLLCDLDTVILAINCSAAAAKIFHGRQVRSKRLCLTFMSRLFAFSTASFSTLVYIILQLLLRFSSFRCIMWLHTASTTFFCNTWTNVQIRCCQILYWSVFLQDNGFRSQSCVEYAVRAALNRHVMWSSLVVDLLLGNLIGLPVLVYARSVCSHVAVFANSFTNEVLRSGCVWLMGVPAGFKLNIELAGVLGMVSLNVIQIWSTLWIFAGFLFVHFIRGLALFAILFGATVSAAVIIDVVLLASLHVSILHRAISLLYSRQIQALSSLWRLFRGRKWNPLRRRLDSYDYSVKQHIVGSLMFTPLLLLLPTTSVFYMFFTILSTAITLTCVLIEVSISVIHCTPYIEVFLWLMKRHIFPSGIWFESLACQNDELEFGQDEVISFSANSEQKNVRRRERSSNLVSVLHSNFLKLGQVIKSPYKKVFSGLSGFVSMLAYGALTGERTPTTLGSSLPTVLPWMVLPAREYWWLCYDSIIGCTMEQECGAHW